MKISRKNYLFAVACNSHGVCTFWAGATNNFKHWTRARAYDFNANKMPAKVFHTMSVINKYITKYKLVKVGENAYKTEKGNVAIVFHREELPLFLAEAKLRKSA